MEFSEILVYILSGYGIVSILALGKIFYTLSTLQLEMKMNRYKCKEDLRRLEEKLYRHIEHDKTLRRDIETLTYLKDELVNLSQSVELPEPHEVKKVLLKG